MNEFFKNLIDSPPVWLGVAVFLVQQAWGRYRKEVENAVDDIRDIKKDIVDIRQDHRDLKTDVDKLKRT